MAERAVLVIGGQPQSLLNFRGPLLKTLAAKGYRVVAAAPSLTSKTEDVSELTSLGVSCRDFPLSRTGLNPLADIRSIFALVRLMRREHPEIVLSYTAKPVIFATLAATIARIPRRYALMTGLGYAFTGKAAGKRRAIQNVLDVLYRIAFRLLDKIFFQNPDDAGAFRDRGLLPRRLPVVIVNGSGVDLARYRPARFPEGPTRYLLIARLLSAKGIREYHSAAAIIRKTRPEAEFHLVGGFDSNPDALRPEEVWRWTADGTLVWHGEVPDVRPFIENCHVFVLPSYREGTPRSVLEAMAMGRAIVTTDAPGCRETVIDGKNGYLVAPRAVEPLARALKRFLDDPKLIARMGRFSRKVAEQKYDARKVNARMLQEMELG